MTYRQLQKIEETTNLTTANEQLDKGWVLTETKKRRKELDHPEFYDEITYILGLPSDLK